MKQPILLIDADGDSRDLVARAAEKSGRGMLLAQTSREAVSILSRRLRQLDLVVVDVDPGTHGMALLEAISGCAERPPMLVITGLEEAYMKPIAREHGAAVCLGKPVGSEQLRTALERASARRSLTCDRWGSILPDAVDKTLDVRGSFRGIGQKLSPTGPSPRGPKAKPRGAIRS